MTDHTPRGTRSGITHDELRLVADKIAEIATSLEANKAHYQLDTATEAYYPLLDARDRTGFYDELREPGGRCAAISDLRRMDWELVTYEDAYDNVYLAAHRVSPEDAVPWVNPQLSAIALAREWKEDDLSLWALMVADIFETLADAAGTLAGWFRSGEAYQPDLEDQTEAIAAYEKIEAHFRARAKCFREGPREDGSYLPAELLPIP